ncbi:MAG TPA: polyprenyl synthetase family protein, partial [Actinomycetota bacterium]
GWVDADGHPADGSGGKAIRPALALLSAEAAGADAREGLPGAVAVQLVHDFSLLHDDLMDGDEERRHRATAWKVFGPALAVLTGDALLALAGQVLFEVPGERGAAAARHLGGATELLILGQAQDLDFEERMDVTVEECLAMTGNKTGALLACSASIGAVLAGAPPATVDGLHAFGLHLGLAFQAVDDLLGIWGEPEVTGKPAWNDLRARKKSMPVTAALSAGGPSSERLAALLGGDGPIGEEDLSLAAKLVETAGGRDLTRAEAERQLTLALDRLGAVGAPAAAHEQLAAVAHFVTTREL